MSGTSTTVCVCAQSSLRKSTHNKTEPTKPPEGTVCDFLHTPIRHIFRVVVGCVVVLVWYYKCNVTNSSSTSLVLQQSDRNG